MRIEINIRQDSFAPSDWHKETSRILDRLATLLQDENSATFAQLAGGGVVELIDSSGNSVGEAVQIVDAHTVTAARPAVYEIVSTESHPMECTYRVTANSEENAMQQVRSGTLYPDTSEPIDLKSPRREVHKIHEVDSCRIEEWYFSDAELRELAAGNLSDFHETDPAFVVKVSMVDGPHSVRVLRDTRLLRDDDVTDSVYAAACEEAEDTDNVLFAADQTQFVYLKQVKLNRAGEILKVYELPPLDVVPPVQGEYIQLLDGNGNPCENHATVQRTVCSAGYSLPGVLHWLVEDMQGESYRVRRNPQYDMPQRKGWVQV